MIFSKVSMHCLANSRIYLREQGSYSLMPKVWNKCFFEKQDCHLQRVISLSSQGIDAYIISTFKKGVKLCFSLMGSKITSRQISNI